MNQPDSPPAANPDDLEQLNLLGIFHFIVGGLMMLFSCFFIIHLVMGLVMIFNPGGFENRPSKPGDEQMLFVMGLFLTGFAACAILVGWTLGGLTIYSGHCLRRHHRRMFSQVIAGIACLFVPFGTLLGVFTIVVLQRDSVRRLYGE